MREGVCVAKLDSQIRLTLDPEPAVSGLEQFAKRWSGVMTGLNQGLELVSKVWSGVERVGAVFAQMSSLASVADAAQYSLAQSLRRVGEQYAGMVPTINAFNASIQRATAIGDEDIIKIEEKLLALGVLPNELERATKATIGYAAATRKDAKEAAQQVARAWTGEAAALKSLGITLKEGEDARSKLTEFYAIAEERGRNLETRIGALNQVWGDLQETLGRNLNAVVEESGAVDKLTDAVDDANVILSQFGTSIGKAYFESLKLEAHMTAKLIPGVEYATGAWQKLVDKIHDYAESRRLADGLGSVVPDDAWRAGYKPGDTSITFGADEVGTIEGNLEKRRERLRKANEEARKSAREEEAWWAEEYRRKINADNEAKENELKRQELHLERMATSREAWHQNRLDQDARELADEERYFNEVWRLKDEREKLEAAHTLKLGEYASQVSLFGLETAGALLVGEEETSRAAKEFFGSLLGIVGRELITLGSAAIGLSTLMSTLGIPIVGAAAGAAAIGIGAAMVVGAGALRSSAAKDAHTATSNTRTSYYTPPSGASSGFNQTAPQAVTYEIHFGALIAGRTPAETGRELQRYLVAAERAAGGR